MKLQLNQAAEHSAKATGILVTACVHKSITKRRLDEAKAALAYAIKQLREIEVD